MKNNIPFPAEKITWFKEKLGIEKRELENLKRFNHIFIEKQSEFSGYFFEYFNRIDETAFLLAHQKHGQHLVKIWENWFGSFFRESFSDSFLKALWISGLVHVKVNIDHRYIMLSYSILRQFCQNIVKHQIPQEEKESILAIIDKMVDFCLLIETNAFVEATSKCDMEVVRGISHQVRNPLTVIGGNAIRLLRNSGSIIDHEDIPEICNTIIEESRRLEKMVTDASSYSDMYQKETNQSIILLSSLIASAMARLSDQKQVTLDLTKNIIPEDLEIEGDSENLETMFFHIIRHCLDNAQNGEPEITISAKRDDPVSAFVEIEILNKGFFEKQEEIEKAFVPFYSVRPDGTGLGLSIAKLAANKSLGDIYIDILPEEGMKFFIKLPVPV